MDLNQTEEQRLIQQTARAFFSDKLPLSDVRLAESGTPIDVAGLWKDIADLGWTSMTIDVEQGSASGSFLDQCILLHEFGRALAPLPYRSTCIEAARVIDAADTEKIHSDVIRRIGRGEAIVVLAVDEVGRDSFPRSIQTRAARDGSGFVLSGRKIFVPFADIADQLICVARLPDNSVGLFFVEASAAGVGIQNIRELSEDGTSFEVTLDQVRVSADRVIGTPADTLRALETANEFASVALCAEMWGAMDQVLKMTVSYAQNRVQFGRPIGSFQAVQSLCVDMLEYTEGASHIVHEAAWRLQEGLPASQAVAMARGWVAEGLGIVAQNGHQVHGAIGFTLEHDLQLFSRRMLVAQGILGSFRDSAAEVLQLSA